MTFSISTRGFPDMRSWLLLACAIASGACAASESDSGCRNGTRCGPLSSAGSGSGNAGASGASAGSGNSDTAGASSAGTGAAGTSSAGTGVVGNAGASGAGSAGIGSAGVGAAGEAGVGGPNGSCIVDGTTYDDGASNIPAGDDCNTCSCTDGMLACTLIACDPIPPECVVARRLDECCGQWQATPIAEALTNACVVRYPGTNVPADTAAGCNALRPATCTTEPCVVAEPTSRLAAPRGEPADGCTFIDECTSAADCALANDQNASCCACPESVPRALLGAPACFTAVTDTQNIRIQPQDPIPCGPCKSAGTCGACPPPEEPTCVVGDAANRCR